MAIFTYQDRFLKWRYVVSELYILYPEEEPEKLPNERLVTLYIENHYETNIFPIIQIELVLENSRYLKIIKNKDTVKFKIRIQKYYRDMHTDERSLKRDYINDTFDIILDENYYNANQGFEEEKLKSDYINLSIDDTNQLEQMGNKFEFYLFKSDVVQASKTNVNQVLKDATIMDGIHYVLSEAGFTRMLMSPPDNRTVYPELLIPPMTATQALLFLDCYYGTYKKGAMMYFDIDRNYIIPYDGKCHCWEKNEVKETTIVIPKRNSTFSSDLCTVERNENGSVNYIIGSNSNLTIDSNSVTYDILAGNNIESVNTYTGEVSNTTSSAVSKTNTNREILITNRTVNPWFNQIYTTQSEARSVVISMILGEYDVSYLKPNAKFRIIFEDSALTKKYKGYYQLVSAIHHFVHDGTEFAPSTDVCFKRLS